MKLDEAKEILKLNGYLLEDTETQDDEHSDLVRNSGVGDFKSIKKIVDLEKKHLDLEDKIANAKKFNSWNNKDEETKIELLKDLLDDGYDIRDDNPYSEQDIMADFYDIDNLADIYDEVVDKLEDLYEGDDFGSDWDMWLLDHTTFIIKDILNGKTAEQIIKKFKKYF